MSRNLVTLLSTVLFVGLLANAANAGCVWKGTAPFCSGHCNAGEIQIKRQSTNYTSPGEPGFGSKCATGAKALCCTACPSGLVWREKTYLDVVCVTPAERAAAQGH
jgi:hypothetical protein